MKQVIIGASCIFLLFLVACTSDVNGQADEVGNNTAESVENVDRNAELEEVENALESDPQNPELIAKKADLLMKLARVPEGVPHIAQAFRLDSNDLFVRRVHANYMLAQVKVLAARKDFNFIVEKNPGDAEAYLGLARTYAIEDYYEKAFEYTDLALKRDKYMREAYELKGMMFRAQNKLDLAISSYQTAVEVDPDFYSGYVALGNLFEIKNDPIAYEYYKTAHEVDSMGMEAIYGMALYLQYHNEEATAKELYRKMLVYDSTYFAAYFNQGWIKLVLENDMDSATYFFEKTLEIVPNYADAWYNLGLAQVEKNNPKKALDCFKNVLKIDPKNKAAQTEIDALVKR